MDVKQITELIKSELATWTNAQLHTALDFCVGKCEETHNAFWEQLYQMVELEIIDRGGRR